MCLSRNLSVICCLPCLLWWANSLKSNAQSLEPPFAKDIVFHLRADSLQGARNAGEGSSTISAWQSLDPKSRWRFEPPNEDSRPSLQRVEDNFFARFDGENDSLRCLGPETTLRELTLAIVVAPHQNPGDFRGLVSSNQKQRRDYESGFTLDLGPMPSRNCNVLNWEGAGFGGARNLLSRDLPMKALMVVQCKVDADAKQASLSVDGRTFEARDFLPRDIHIDEMTIGARHYTNGPGEQQVRGFAAADIAEIILYNRDLSASESIALHDYLEKKHADLAQRMAKTAASIGHYVEQARVPNPPPVHFLVPGFQPRELPLELSNVNNVRYRSDGTLVTLGYNGDIHLVQDSDGDGLEDQSQVFWKNRGSLRGPIGLVWVNKGQKYLDGLYRLREGENQNASTVPQNLQGAIVASKGKISALVDLDGDDVADREWIIAEGWKEIRQNVDAVGLTIGPDGSLYFGLGTADYANAYQVDSKGNSEFQLSSDRGTIQRVDLQSLHRETVCTGVRFPIGIECHPNGDLFCTDQEGATWLSNGNPLDELLHIEKGKHYGFPPRHPKYNPKVLDEPSVFDYGPQHQSTCGLTWNRRSDSQKLFGPALWQDNAFVCGESRGKLWRTKVVRSDSGYIATSQLIACLQMLTVDATVSPDGDLVVACHSGPPDWGTGPEGAGKLFKIRMVDPTAPKPMMAWAQSETELRIALDHPLTLDLWKNLARELSVEVGMHVRAGDHFENLIPPYAVVQQQSLSDRQSWPILAASVTSDLRIILLQVPPLKTRKHVAIRWKRDSSSKDILEDYAIDTALDGVIATWTPTVGEPLVAWLPHLDLEVSKELCRGSALHDVFFRELRGEGELSLQTKTDLYHWLRPNQQPGTTLDYEWPSETVTLRMNVHGAKRIEAGSSFGANVGESIELKVNDDSDPSSPTILSKSWTVTDSKESLPIQLRIHTNDAEKLRLEAYVVTSEDPNARPIPLSRLHLPWSSKEDSKVPLGSDVSSVHAELAGGNWGRGRRLFQSDALGCFRCHSMNAMGANIGPDLSNLVHRDYESVLRDIVQPSYSINPDFIGHVVQMKDESTITGVLRTEEGRLLIGDAKGQTHRLEREEIEAMKVSQLSIMPTGLLDKLSVEERRDLMTYLLGPPPQMPLNSPLKAPPVRTIEEVQRVLSGSADIHAESLLRMVLVAGNKDHGPGEHDYPAWQEKWVQLLSAASNVELSTAWDFPTDEQIAAANVLIFFQKGNWNEKRAEKLDAFLARGGGAIYLHWAVNGEDAAPEFSNRIGLASRAGKIRYRHGPLHLEMHNTDHPILRNVESLDLYDESYWLLTGDPSRVVLLASSLEDNAQQPQMWCYERGEGRVFVAIPGHYNWTFDDPIFRVLLLRAIAWSAREPVDRFNDLVLPGARVIRKP